MCSSLSDPTTIREMYNVCIETCTIGTTEEGVEEVEEVEEVQQKQSEMMGRTERAVRFCQYEEIHDIPEWAAPTPKEAKDVWYNEDDFEYFFNQSRAAAERLEKREKKVMLLSLAKRGIEGMTKAGLERTKELRSSAIGLVLAEQDSQWDRGTDDDGDGIATLYKAQSVHANMVALMKGLLIEKEVQTMQRREAAKERTPAETESEVLTKPKKKKSTTSTGASSKTKKSKTKKSTKKTKKASRRKVETADGQTDMTVSFAPVHELEVIDDDDCLDSSSFHEQPASALSMASGFSTTSVKGPCDDSMASVKSFASCSTESTQSLSTFDSPEVTSRKQLAIKKTEKKSKSSSRSKKSSKSSKERKSSSKDASTHSSKKRSSSSTKTKKSLLPFRSPGKRKQGLLVQKRVDYYEGSSRSLGIDPSELEQISFHQLCEQF